MLYFLAFAISLALEGRADKTQLRQALVFGSEEVNQVTTVLLFGVKQPKTPSLGQC
jgi:hypothetical protein